MDARKGWQTDGAIQRRRAATRRSGQVTAQRRDEPLSAASPKPLFAVEVTRDVRIPTPLPDVTLAATLIRPVGAGRVPALVTIYPYVKDAGAGIQNEAEMRWFAARGYACLLVDIRGTGASDGVQRATIDPTEADDGVAAIDWAAAQPWCTGDVGMWGMSYGAGLTLRTAARNPPHLKAILAIEGRIDVERDFVHPQGNAGCLGSVMWGGFMLYLQLLPPFEDYGSPAQTARWLRRRDEMEPWLIDFVRHQPGDPAWRAPSLDPAQISVPAFCVAGLRDLFRDPTVRAYEAIGGPKKLLFGPWAHSLPHMSPFGAIDFRKLALEWWDYWLRGEDNGAMTSPPVTLCFSGGSPDWRQFDSWPPPAERIRFEADAAGVLVKAAGERVIAIPFRTSPVTGALSGLYELPTNSFRPPLDQHEDDLLGTVFETGAHAEDMLIGGKPSLTVRWADEAAPERLVVHLTDVDSEGGSRLIAKGVLRDPAPGSRQAISLGAVGYRLAAGHRLRIVLSSSDFPRLWPLAKSAQQAVIAGLTLELPVVPQDARVATAFAAPAYDDAVSPPLVQSVEPIWTIQRDLAADGVEVTVGGRMAALTPNREHRFEMNQMTTARVVRGDPAAASVHGRYSGSMQMQNGEVVKVEVSVRATATSVEADGKIDIDGKSVFSRQWCEAVAAQGKGN
jgi:putative CocE/NonD family hydrolase